MSIRQKPFDKELDVEAMAALDKMADKVLNYRPKDRQPKPPKPKRKQRPKT